MLLVIPLSQRQKMEVLRLRTKMSVYMEKHGLYKELHSLSYD